MPGARYSEEFKAQVVREVVEKDRTTASVASSYGIPSQTVGNWVIRHRRAHASADEKQAAEELAEIRRLRAQNRELRQEVEFLKKSSGPACEGEPVTRTYEVILREKARYPVSSVCRWAGVSCSGYRDWEKRRDSPRALRRKGLAAMVLAESRRSEGTYGYRRITVVLQRRGVHACEDTVRALMREQGLVAVQPDPSSASPTGWCPGQPPRPGEPAGQ